MFGFFTSYFLPDEVNSKRFTEAFNIKELHSGILANLYLAVSQGYAKQKNIDKALYMLKQYEKLVTGSICPLSLHGDDFFNLLDAWFAEFGLDKAPPRDGKTIKKDMADAVINNPAFFILLSGPYFQRIAGKLENSI